MTPTALLFFEANKLSRSYGRLADWENLSKLSKIRRPYAQAVPEYLTLELGGKKIEIVMGEGREEEFLKLVIKQMADNGVPSERIKKKNTKIKESEVTKEAIA